MNKTTETTSPAALAIANWWADHVFGGTMGRIDHPDHPEPNSGTMMALAVLAGEQGVPAESSRRDQFVAALAKRVDADLNRHDYGVTIGVDYGPDPMLADAAREAGVPTGSFPWKTMTWTHRDYVTAALGYGASPSLVWSAPDWAHPACGAGQYGDAPDYERQPWKCSAPRYHEGEHVFDTPSPLCQHVYQGGFRNGQRCLRPEDNSDVHDMSDQWAASHEFVGADA